MDLTRAVKYRGLDLNTATVVEGVIEGITIDVVDYHQIDAVGYREKRSLSDGIDASDVFLGARYVKLSGTIYGSSRAEFFDHLQDLRAAFLPTSAFYESPSTLGYLPLTFDEPTLDTTTWPDGFIPKQMFVRPYTTPVFQILADHIGGDPEHGFSCEWSINLEARDPRVYLQSLNTTYFSLAAGTSGSGIVTNRGPYPAPLDILIFVPAVANDRMLTLTAFGSVVEIRIPDGSDDRTARYDGLNKTLFLDEGGVSVLRMDLLSFHNGLTHPLVSAGDQSFSWTYTNYAGTAKAINALSRFWFAEAWV